MLSTKGTEKIKPLIIILLLIPSFYWTYLLFVGNLGVNPIEKLMDNLGEMALRLIIFTLFISSLSEIKYFRSLIAIRRTIGLFAFYYICLHFLSYIVLDHFFNMEFIIKDIIKRPFITFGFISFLCLIPMAVTSSFNLNNFSSSRLLEKPFKRTVSRLYELTSMKYNLNETKIL